MKKIQLFILSITILSLTACTSSEDQARALIQQSIKAHGGQERWDQLNGFEFLKKSTLYQEDGSEESSLEQQVQFKRYPYFEARMNWNKDSTSHRVSFDGLKTRYMMGSNEILNEGFLASKKKEIDAAFYVMDKPFALLEGTKKLTYIGLVTLPDQREMECIEVIDGDPTDPKTDRWWYYFHPQTHQLVAYKVKTSDHYSLVYNLEMDRSLGIAFPMKRESFRVDSLGQVLYLRASYTYTNYQKLD
ncbi:hypothetical protein [Mongoliitalea daihaiensis]|uniref:hypothetical protein n=1 Tax=Mongoliitalea daihaiensis TaxID=2782006 RepID=UPI001F324FB6|nr:hypothetical protein [Mongoliitalea daihaiensis]UJP64791.1 hypothetical protein IPZ59_18680 [Mongoliitalea daihaiensis]